MDTEGEQAGRGGATSAHGDSSPTQQLGVVGEASQPGGVPLSYRRQVGGDQVRIEVIEAGTVNGLAIEQWWSPSGEEALRLQVGQRKVAVVAAKIGGTRGGDSTRFSRGSHSWTRATITGFPSTTPSSTDRRTGGVCARAFVARPCLRICGSASGTGRKPVRSSRPRMIVPPPGRLAKALNEEVSDAGSPPAAAFTSTLVVSPPDARSVFTRSARSSVLARNVTAGELHFKLVGLHLACSALAGACAFVRCSATQGRVGDGHEARAPIAG